MIYVKRKIDIQRSINTCTIRGPQEWGGEKCARAYLESTGSESSLNRELCTLGALLGKLPWRRSGVIWGLRRLPCAWARSAGSGCNQLEHRVMGRDCRVRFKFVRTLCFGFMPSLRLCTSLCLSFDRKR